MKKKALITGFTGQDGSYLAELLVTKGYDVHATTRHVPDKLRDGIVSGIRAGTITLHSMDLADAHSIKVILDKVSPDEIYNLAAQSHVQNSRNDPEGTATTNALGVIRLLEVVRKSGPSVRIYQASSSEMFGSTAPPQNERSCFSPTNPYACAKAFAFWMVRNYRRENGLLASNGILFNHESPRRGDQYVTRKITSSLALIRAGRLDHITLGNLESKRDWGFAPEYVKMMWKMMQMPPDDYVIGTGRTHSVREFLEKVFDYADMEQDKHVTVDMNLYRPQEQNELVADPTKAVKELEWDPKIDFDDLVKIMVDADFRLIGLEPIGEGDEILARKFPERWWVGD